MCAALGYRHVTATFWRIPAVAYIRNLTLMTTLLRCGLLILATVTLLAGCTSVVPPAPGPQSSITPIELTQDGIIAAINSTRAANGKPPLHYNVQLESAARAQANVMAAKDKLSHDVGGSLRQRVTTVGYEGAVGENVAGGQKTLEQAISGWLNSPAHRDTLLSTRFEEFGLAVATVPANRPSMFRTYWAFIAGGPSSAWY